MYNYIASNKKTGIHGVDSNFNYFITEEIKKLSKLLYLRSELYIGQAKIFVDENNKITRSKNFTCISNILIFQVLHDIKNCNDFANEEIRNSLKDKSVDNLDDIVESGSSLRMKLIRLCKLYLQHKDIELISKTKSTDNYELAKESFLAEEALGIYTKEIYDSIAKVYKQKVFKANNPGVQVIRPDIILINNNVLLVIDIKVYNTIGIKNHNKFEYSSNANRFQVNSYIGKCLDELVSDKNKIIRVIGLLVHIVDNELYDKNKDLQGNDITVEKERPMYLYMIQDNGLDAIFEDYRCIIDNYVFM